MAVHVYIIMLMHVNVPPRPLKVGIPKQNIHACSDSCTTGESESVGTRVR